MPLADRAGVFAGAGSTFRSRDPVAVRLPRLAFLPDQGAGDRGHLPEPSLRTESLSFGGGRILVQLLGATKKKNE